MPEMLTITQTVERIKRRYPASTIGAATLRTWQKEGRFHSVQAGRRILISWSSLVDFLSGKTSNREGK